MKKSLSFLICTIGVVFSIYGQSLEAGFFLGAANYQGDLHPSNFVFGETKVAYGGFVRYPIKEYLYLKASITKGAISGSDANSTEESGRKNRNLNFRSDILDFGIQAEFHLFPLIFGEQKFISPYFVTGINGFTFNPEGFYIDRYYDLAPLGTEGQYLEGSGVSPYKKFQLSIPMGLGLDFRISDYNTIGLEFSMRKTFTDHLDDVSGSYPDLEALSATNPLAATLSFREVDVNGESSSRDRSGTQRGIAENKDWYYFVGLNFGFNLNNILSLGDGPGNYSAF